MARFYVVKRGKEYWVSGGGETSVYSVVHAPEDSYKPYHIIREWWWHADPEDTPEEREVVERHLTLRNARQRMGRMLKPLTTAGRTKSPKRVTESRA